MQQHHTRVIPWKREEAVAHMTAFEAAWPTGTSQRAYAREQGLPRTTLQYWQARKHALDASPVLIACFESPDGLAFLHRLVLAIEFVGRFVAGCGRSIVQAVIRLAGLEAVAATGSVRAWKPRSAPLRPTSVNGWPQR